MFKVPSRASRRHDPFVCNLMNNPDNLVYSGKCSTNARTMMSLMERYSGPGTDLHTRFIEKETDELHEREVTLRTFQKSYRSARRRRYKAYYINIQEQLPEGSTRTPEGHAVFIERVVDRDSGIMTFQVYNGWVSRQNMMDSLYDSDAIASQPMTLPQFDRFIEKVFVSDGNQDYTMPALFFKDGVLREYNTGSRGAYDDLFNAKPNFKIYKRLTMTEEPQEGWWEPTFKYMDYFSKYLKKDLELSKTCSSVPRTAVEESYTSSLEFIQALMIKNEGEDGSEALFESFQQSLEREKERHQC